MCTVSTKEPLGTDRKCLENSNFVEIDFEMFNTLVNLNSGEPIMCLNGPGEK
jgi:hypothetical protein